MERRKRRSRLISSAVVWAVFVMMWMQFSVSPSVLAMPVNGGSADGSTTCGPSTTYCDADVYNLVLSSVLSVSEGDDVFYTMDVEWHDYRSLYSPQAAHHFTISVVYPGRLPYAVQRPVFTTGQESGSDTITLWIYDVDIDVSVSVSFSASIYIASPYCYDYDSEGGQQYYG